MPPWNVAHRKPFDSVLFCFFFTFGYCMCSAHCWRVLLYLLFLFLYQKLICSTFSAVENGWEYKEWQESYLIPNGIYDSPSDSRKLILVSNYFENFNVISLTVFNNISFSLSVWQQFGQNGNYFVQTFSICFYFFVLYFISNWIINSLVFEQTLSELFIFIAVLQFST